MPLNKTKQLDRSEPSSGIGSQKLRVVDFNAERIPPLMLPISR
jgi:hypothetical protein